jgi:NAD(P)-dependent dehydrogenase (short-subunit alcohol dehydrogenase family)
MFHQIEARFGGVDIFVANAATGGFRPMLETTDKHWG